MTAPESNDKDGPVRPPVIDIEAEDVTPPVESESDKIAQDDAPLSPPPPPPKSKPHHWRRWGVLLLLLLAVAGGAWLYKDYGQRFWPSDQITALTNRIATLEAGNKTLNDQLVNLGGSLESLKSGEAAQGDLLVAARGARQERSKAVSLC